MTFFRCYKGHAGRSTEYQLEGGRSRETSEEAIARMQEEKDDGMDHGGSSRRWEKWFDSRYILKVEPTGFAAVLDVGWWEMMVIQGRMTQKFWSE